MTFHSSAMRVCVYAALRIVVVSHGGTGGRWSRGLYQPRGLLDRFLCLTRISPRLQVTRLTEWANLRIDAFFYGFRLI